MTQKHFTIYDIDTGEVQWIGSCSSRDYDKQHIPEGMAILEGSGKHSYVDISDPQQPVLTPQTSFDCILDKSTIQANGQDKATISDIPVGTSVSVSGVGSQLVNDGVVSVTSDIAEVIVINLTHFKHLDKTYTITAE